MRLSGEWLKMTGVRRYKFILCLLLLVTGLFLVSCSSDSGSEEPAGGTTQTETAANTQNAQKTEAESGTDAESKESGAEAESKESGAGGDGQEAGSYEAPAFQDVDFSEKKAEGNDSVQIDLSHVASGYVSYAVCHTYDDKTECKSRQSIAAAVRCAASYEHGRAAADENQSTCADDFGNIFFHFLAPPKKFL